MKGNRRKPELLGYHGIVLRSGDPAALARRWTELTGMKPLRRTRKEIVLGEPELFVVVRKATRSAPPGLEELHVAVEEIGVTNRKVRPDPLGGDSWRRSAGDFDVVLRQFRRPAAAAWRRRRSR